jgi:bifunctional DNase/RNase
MLEMSIDSIRVSLMNYQRVVILKEKDSDRYLPIWIGPAEADAIAVKLQDVSIPRPLTHDLLGNIIGVLGGTLQHVSVNDLQNDTFYAKLVLDVDGRSLEVDSRPSDAIALAVRSRVPIYVDESVLEKAGIIMDQETGKPLLEGKPEGAGERITKVGEEELRGMSAFKDLIEGLNLEGLDKNTS